MEAHQFPVAIVGAGPIGLSAAAHLVARGERPVVFEAGEAVGASVRRWAHVRVFSPWSFNVDPVAAVLLAETGWQPPHPKRLPTGAEIVERYLEPLANHPGIAPTLRLGTRVTAVPRRGYDKVKTVGRERAPFVVHVRTATGEEEQVLARAVIDASGTYERPNPLGADGIPAPGEAALADRIFAAIPDVLGAHRTRYAGKRVLVIGAGHSSFNVLLDLAELARDEPATEIVWAVRRRSARGLFGGEERDALPTRGHLGTRLRALVADGKIALITGFRTVKLERTPAGVVVHGETEALPPVDEVVAVTGFRPDLRFLSELRLGLDPALESPTALAPLIDPNVHSCGTVPPHGAAELAHPEPGFYMVGMKSYGRAPTFLLRTGYEQVRSVVAALTGDAAGAAAVEWELPETGVCSTDGEGTSCDVPALAGTIPLRVAAVAGVGCCVRSGG